MNAPQIFILSCGLFALVVIAREVRREFRAWVDAMEEE